MKDIFIFGVPRSGKTTLSNMLIKKLYNYQILSIDAIRNSFGDIFPELEINDQGGKNNEILLPNYITRLLYWNHRILRNSQGYIVEGCQILPDKAKEVLDLNNSIVIYLGHGSLLPEQIVSNIRKYDTPRDYSYKESDNILLRNCKEDYKLNKIIMKKCEEYDFKYIDTSINREKVLYDTMQKIIAFI